MSQVIPEKYRDLFQKRAFASLGTLMPDGRPQVTPVWCDFDGEHVIFNSAKGRQKDRNVRRDPRVSLAVIDPEKWDSRRDVACYVSSRQHQRCKQETLQATSLRKRKNSSGRAALQRRVRSRESDGL